MRLKQICPECEQRQPCSCVEPPGYHPHIEEAELITWNEGVFSQDECEALVHRISTSIARTR
jgi:hypothetical protein